MRRKVILILSILSLALGLGLLILVEREARPVRRFEVQGNHYLTSGEILQLSGLRSGGKVSRRDLSAAAGRIKNHPAVLDVDFRRVSSGSEILILIRERSCAAIIRAEDRLFDVDEELVILSSGGIRCSDVPLVAGPFVQKSGRFEDRTLRDLMSSYKGLKVRYPELLSRISEIRIKRGGMRLYIAHSRIRVELAGGLTEENIRKLYAALSYFEKENRSSGLIDLRGPDAVLVPEL